MPDPGARKTREASAFGPSTWFSLSLGRKQRAEPRWLLPMLCRNAGLSKDAIGAIRVQYQETFIEILSAAVPAMKSELGPDLELEQGARLTELPGPPDLDASPKGPPAAPIAPQIPPRRDEDAPAPSAKRAQADDVTPAATGTAERRKGKADARQGRPDQHKPKGPKHAKPSPAQAKSRGSKETGQSGKAAAKDGRTRKDAADPSKPLGPGRERGKGRKAGDKPRHAKGRTTRGPDARPDAETAAEIVTPPGPGVRDWPPVIRSWGVARRLPLAPGGMGRSPSPSQRGLITRVFIRSFAVLKRAVSQNMTAAATSATSAIAQPSATRPEPGQKISKTPTSKATSPALRVVTRSGSHSGMRRHVNSDPRPVISDRAPRRKKAKRAVPSGQISRTSPIRIDPRPMPPAAPLRPNPKSGQATIRG